MHRLALILGLLLVATPPASADEVYVEEIGLEQAQSSQYPNRVRVHITLDQPRPLPLTLEVRVRKGDSPGDLSDLALYRDDKTTQEIHAPGQKVAVEIPVSFFPGSDSMYLALRDARGQQIGRISDLPISPQDDSWITILCHEDDCSALHKQFQDFFTTPDDYFNQRFRQVMLRKRSWGAWQSNPPSQWWGYSESVLVVLALPPAELSEEQRSALENYLRHGGKIAVLENASAGFLGSYSDSSGKDQEFHVGRGKLIRSLDLARLRKELPTTRRRVQILLDDNGSGALGLDGLQQHLGTRFDFPSFLTLVTWLLGYIVVVGAVNFGWLRRKGRLEWGWITVPALALLFAVALYLVGAAKRPPGFLVEQFAIYWMDDRSPVAAVTSSIRVSAPERREVTLMAPVTLLHYPEFRWRTDLSSVFAFETQANLILNLRRKGEQQEMGLQMLQWSFRDFEFRDTVRLPGTVLRTPAGLRNESGRNFQQAVFEDERGVYSLGPLPPGAEVDLSSLRPQNLAACCESLPSADDGARKPFRLEEFLPQIRSSVSPKQPVFLGLSAEPDLGARLHGMDAERRNYAVTIVGMSDK